MPAAPVATMLGIQNDPTVNKLGVSVRLALFKRALDRDLEPTVEMVKELSQINDIAAEHGAGKDDFLIAGLNLYVRTIEQYCGEDRADEILSELLTNY